MTSRKQTNLIVLTLAPRASETDATARLRGLLKVALRRFGFRCVRIEPWKAENGRKRARER